MNEHEFPTAPVTAQAADAQAVQRAAEALARLTGLKVDAHPDRPRIRIVHGYQYFEIDIHGHDAPYPYLAQVRAIPRREAITALGNGNARRNRERPLLLVAPYITPDLAEYCRQQQIEFIDTAGNAYLNRPPLFAFVVGQRLKHPLPAQQKRGGAATAAAAKVAFALMCQPALAKAPYREIAAAAGVALGAVGTIQQNLEARRLILATNERQERRLLDPRRMLDEWVINYPTTLRTKLMLGRFTATNEDWWKQADLTQIGGLWGGEIAGARYTNYLRPVTATVYLDETGHPQGLTQLVVRNRLKPDPQGEIEVLRKFWNFPPAAAYPDLVPPILAYADLINTHDPRNTETANVIYDKAIAHADIAAEQTR